MPSNPFRAFLLKCMPLWVLTASFCLIAATQARSSEPTLAFRAVLPKDIIGHVTDAKGDPLAGATVTVKGTKRIVLTDANGDFNLKGVDDASTLVVTFAGYTPQEVSVKGISGPLTVQFADQQNQLGEVVVVGYGTRQKKDLTGAVAQVKATQFENENPRSVQDMLRGNAPGLDVSLNAGPKGGGSLLVRGRGSLIASSSPLLVVDGVIYQGSLDDVNPNDIATIDILKDASSAAVFGARSANGVILITTKRGKSGKPQISVNANYNLNKIAQYPRLLSPDEFINWRTDVLWSMRGFDSTSRPNIKYQFTNPSKLPAGLSVDQWKALTGATGDAVDIWLNRLRLTTVEVKNYKDGKVVDWEDIMYNRQSKGQDYTVAISGKKNELSYYTSLGYLENEGLSVGEKYKTFRARVNVEAEVAKFLTFGMNMQFADRDESPWNVTLGDMIRTTPYGQLYNDDGVTLRTSTNDDPGNNQNPFLNITYRKRLQKTMNLFGSFYVKGKLPFGFFYQTNFTPRLDWYKNYNHISSAHPLVGVRGGVTVREDNNQYQWQLDNIIGWAKNFGKHSFEVTSLINAEKYQSWYQRVNAESFSPNDNLGYNNIAAARTVVITNDDQYATADALMGRLNYNYSGKYLLTVTGRRDGYSAFGLENRRAFFPSAALGWVFTDEKFLTGITRFIEYGKLRVSYGENGNREIGRYAALANLDAGSYEYITPGGTRYSVGRVQAANMANPKLRWERNRSMNIGVDFTILKGNLSGSIDWYDRSTNDLLVNRTLPVMTGFASVIANLGQVDNRGFEVMLNSINMKRNNLSWRSNVTFWTNQNKIVRLYGPVPVIDATGKITGYVEKNDEANRWFIGRQISDIYDYKVAGVWQIADDAKARSYGFTPGDFRLEDLNNDGKYTAIDDRTFVGQTTPKFSFNVRNEFTLFRHWDVSFSLYGRVGLVSIFNEARNVDLFYDRSQFYRRPYWTPTNPINDYAKMMSAAGGTVAFNVYRNSSFVRLNNISVAYTVPKEVLDKYKFQSIKLYINVQNGIVFSPWNYFDPENKGLTPTIVNFGLNTSL
ncbi:MAG: SusC/RagA family TonB-linked outer membrane protein [Bacteroidetes bacterium]|nr:SusC/RagA family TonB-linked outer membrane protein [Bacteroidota bacterium]